MSGFQPHKDRTATIPLVVPLSWVDRLNLAATERGITRSQLIRNAVDAAVFSGRGEQPGGDSAARTSAAAEG
jgi:hypothetical protein